MSRLSAACPWSPATFASSARGSRKHNSGRLAARPVLVLAACFLLSCLAGLGLAQGIDDPVEKFCRRFGHQTALIDRKLYIDGGFINYNPLTTSESTNRTSMTQPYLCLGIGLAAPRPPDDRVRRGPWQLTNDSADTFLSYIDLDVDGAKDMPQVSMHQRCPSCQTARGLDRSRLVYSPVLLACVLLELHHVVIGLSSATTPNAWLTQCATAVRESVQERFNPQREWGGSLGRRRE